MVDHTHVEMLLVPTCCVGSEACRHMGSLSEVFHNLDKIVIEQARTTVGGEEAQEDVSVSSTPWKTHMN